MTTPRSVERSRATYVATPSAQRRTFSKVKSSAIRARQPSVPNTIRVGANGDAVSVTHEPPLQHTGRAGPGRAAWRREPLAGARPAAPGSSYRLPPDARQGPDRPGR